MLINPNVALERGWITLPAECQKDLDKYVQPNAIDFTIDRMFGQVTGSDQQISEETRTLARVAEMPAPWTMFPGEFYDAMSSFKVAVPDDVACTLIVRSSFNRAGIALTSGLYDSGFNGNIGFALHNRSRNKVKTYPGTRIGQILFHHASASGSYTGIYNDKLDKHWSEPQ